MANQIPPLELVIQARNEAVKVVDGFIADLKAAGVETGALEGRANQLNSGLQKLAQQQQLINQFRAQKDAVAVAASAYDNAQQQAQKLARELAQTSAPTARQTADFERARAAVTQADQAYQQAQQRLQTLRAQLAETGISSNNLAEANRRIKAEMDAANASVVKLAQEARNTSQAQQAMGVLGVRSAQQIEAEIAKVRAAMQTLQSTAGISGSNLATAMRAGEQQIKALERELRSATGQMTMADKAAGFLKGTMGQMFGGSLLANGAMAVGNAIAQLGHRFVQTAVDGERLQKSLDAVYKNSDLTRKQMEFVRKLANEAGVEMRGLSEQFVGFSASTKQANIPLEVSNALFASVTKAASTLGLGSERTGNALLALSQMASKGTVAMEELRGQLGEALPGALGLTAKGLGLTEQQLIKLVESGGLAARDLFPALAKALQEMHGDTNTLSGGWNRLQNTITSGLQKMAEGGGGADVLNAALRVLTVTVSVLMFALQGVFEMVSLVGKGLAALAATVTGNSGALRAFADDWQAANQRMLASAKNIAIASGAIKENTKEAQQNKDAVGQMGDSWVAIGVRLKQAQEDYAKAAENQKKYTEAAKLEGESLVQLARLRGDQPGIVQAEYEASVKLAEALAKEAQKHRDLLDSLQAELEQKKAFVAAHPEEAAARAEELKQLQDKVDKQKAETEAVQQSTKSAEADLLVKKQAVQGVQDQKRTLEQMRAAMDAANKTTAEAEMLDKKGLISKTDLAVAQGRAAQATASYNAALKLHNENQQRAITLEKARLDVGMQAADIALRQAELDGNASAYKEALIKKKEIEIAQLRLSIKVKQAEADATIAQAQATLAELKATNQINPEKERELNLAIQLAKIKKEEAGLMDKSIDLMKTELEQLERSNFVMDQNGKITQQTYGNNARAAQDYGNTVSSVTAHNIDAINRENQVREQTTQILEKQVELERKRIGVDKEGFSTDKNGNRLVMGSEISTRTGIVNFLKSAGVDNEEVARSIANQAADSYGNVIRMSNPLQAKYGTSTLSMALLKAAEEYTFSGKKSAAAASASTEARQPSSSSSAALAPSSQPAPVVEQRTYQINLAGYGSISTDQAGAAAIDNFMRALESSKAATGRF